MAARSGGYYRAAFKGERGVTQVDPLSPTIFNVFVDAVVRHWLEGIQVGGFTEIGYVPKSREIYQKEPVMPLFFRSFIIFYLRRFTILNEVSLLTDGETSKSHDSPTIFKMALY